MASELPKSWPGNGVVKNGKAAGNSMRLDDPPKKDEVDWKLMIDPFLKGKAHIKVVRYAGRIDGSEVPVVVRDPRDRTIQLRRNKDIEFTVPKFKYDKWSVGSPPLKSIFIYGLNDNIDEEFLTNLFKPLGAIDQLKVYYHNKTRRHLGIAYASFRTCSTTKEIIAKYHGTSIMGNLVSIKPDPLCQITKKALDCLTRNPQSNIPEILQSIQLKSHQKKTAAWAFKHNERSQNYYTARGKTRHAGEHGKAKGSDHQQQHEPHTTTEKSIQKPNQGVAAKEEEHDEPTAKVHLVERKSKRSRDSDGVTSADVKSKSLKVEQKQSHHLVIDEKMEEKLKEFEREKKLYLSDSIKYEDWRMRHELQIRADKTNRYIKDHYGNVSEVGGSNSSSSSSHRGPDQHKYKEYSSSSHYDKYYDRYGSSRSSTRSKDKYYESSSSSSKYDKYGKYYDYYEYRKSKEYYGKSGKEYDRYLESRDALPPERYLDPPDYHTSSSAAPEWSSRSGYERSNNKRRRSRSPEYRASPIPGRVSGKISSPSGTRGAPSSPTSRTNTKTDSTKGNGSSTSHDTGYNSISPAIHSPKPGAFDNPYGCARAVPRKDISTLKAVGFKAEVGNTGSLSSSPMSLDEEQMDNEMQIEDISPNTDQQQQQPQYQTAPPPTTSTTYDTEMPPVMPHLPPELYPHSNRPPAGHIPPMLPFYQTGQWLHAYPDVYRQYYHPEEAADILARREAEKEAAKKQKEIELQNDRRNQSIELFITEMMTILKKDIKVRLIEKVAFVKLDEVWFDEQEIKRKEEEEIAKKNAEILKANPNQSGPAMLSLSEMRSISDAKSDSHIRHQSHVRQANLSFKVPKLSNKLGMRAQVIVKKPITELSEDKIITQAASDDDVKDEDLLGKRKSQTTSRYNTIYSSSDESVASDTSEDEEEEEEVKTKVIEDEEVPVKIETEEVKEEIEIKPIDEKFKPRSYEEEELILEGLFREELCEEDKNFFKMAYEALVAEEDAAVDDTVWITPPEVPKPPRRSRQMSSAEQGHRTGCARTEGYYKITRQEKIAMKLSSSKGEVPVPVVTTPPKKGLKNDGKQAARSTRAKQRRQATHYFDVSDVQYLQLQSRRKMVRFQRSNIHEWGLFALEPITADEMVIEYVGEVIREAIADIREKGYERQGIGSSYMFRIDQSSYIVDATHRGSISRFINHNCDPNCYARVISVGNKKKVVIYSKRDIAANEEITYDYKFAIEDDDNKIPCLCRAAACRGFLN